MKFYRNLFAILAFAFFLAGLNTEAPFAFAVAMALAMLSRTAEKKGWPDPAFRNR